MDGFAIVVVVVVIVKQKPGWHSSEVGMVLVIEW